MKNILLTILKYLVFAMAILVGIGALALNNKLPALIPDDMAVQLKKMSQETLDTIQGRKPVVTVGSSTTKFIKKSEATIFYSLVDNLFMDGRLKEVKAYARINEKKAADFVTSYDKFLSDLSESQVFMNFLFANADDKKFELKFFIEKYLKEDAAVFGFEVYNLQQKPLLTVMKEPISTSLPEFKESVLLTTFSHKGESYISIFKKVAVDGKPRAIIHLVCKPEILKFSMLTGQFNSTLLLINKENALIYYQSKDLNRNAANMLRLSLVKAEFPVKLVQENVNYRIFYAPFGGDFTAAYVYSPVPLTKLILNVFVYLFVIFLVVILILASIAIYKNVYLKYREEKLKKEEVITGTVSEMVKTLRSTAELTSKMAESSKEDISLIRQTIDKITAAKSDSFQDRKSRTSGQGSGALED